MHKQLGLLFLFLVLLSCNTNTVYNNYKPIKNNKWASEDKIVFEVENTDTISKNNIFITIRNNKDYKFSSIFLIANIKFPSGFQVVDTLEYEMADASGRWLGVGFTDIKENKLFYKEDVVFSEKGRYKFSIQHATRSINDVEGTNPLEGITDVGLRIEKISK